MKEEIGIYIHIPFCKKKCYYCDFCSFDFYKEQEQKEYIDALINEITEWKKENKNKKIKTVYIGGGTPSVIDSKDVMNIISKLELNNYCKEITIEINPGTINEEKLLNYKNAGINRISIGLQSADNNLLKEIGRIHNFEQFIEAYKLAKKVGFENINVDLIIGIPNQTIKDVRNEINILLKLDIQHISIYSLIVEEGTTLEKKIKNNELKLVDEEIERKMYWTVKRELEKKGFIHYEISNFAKKGYESKHNIDCWSQKEYKGFGIAAHSYIDGIRFSNIEDIEKYKENIKNNNFKKNIVIHEEKQTLLEEEKEFVLLGLRKIEGISKKEFNYKFKQDITQVFNLNLKKLKKEGLIQINENIKLSNKGIDLANIVWQEFI